MEHSFKFALRHKEKAQLHMCKHHHKHNNNNISSLNKKSMPREIGWSQESNLLYQIKQLLSRLSGGGGGSSTPAVETYATYSAFPVAGVTGTFYIDGSSGNEYVWDGTKYIYVQSRQSPAPSFPYLPSITFNVGPEGRLSGVTYDRNYNTLWSYPIVQKQYPDPSLNAIVYAIPNSFGSTYTGQTSISINNIVAGTLPTFPSTINLTSATFRDLKYILGSSASTATLSNTLASLSFPELLFLAPGITFGGTPALTTLSFPKLEVIGGLFTNNILTITSFSFPELLEMNSFADTSTAITSYSFPKLKVSGGINLTGTKSSLTSITFPAIEYISAITFPTTSAALTTFTFGPNLKAYGTTAGNFVTTSNSLNQASVDNILIRLAALDGTGGTILFSSRTVTITGGAATPSAAGLAAKATLVARGCTVTTN